MGNSSATAQKSYVKSPIGAIFSEIGEYIKSLFVGFFTPANWIKLIIVAGSTILANFLYIKGEPDNDILRGITRVVSFLTYAGGGISANAAEIIGGTLGKTACASFLVTVLSGKWKGIVKGGKIFAKSFIGKHAKPAKALTGMGIALALFYLSAHDAGNSAIMVVFSAAFIILKAISGNPGFIRKFAASLSSYKKGNVRKADIEKLNAVLSGSLFGIVISIPLDRALEGYSLLWVALAAFVLGTFFGLFSKSGKEAKE